MSKLRAVLLLVLATLFWGFGFVATIGALADFDPMTLTFLRFSIAALIMAPLVGLRPDWREAKAALVPGALLGIGLILQTIGLQSTTATKSGFLTTLYVLFVPVIERFVFHRKLGLRIAGAAGLASIGTLLMASPDMSVLGRGDLFTIACAVVFAFQIVSISFVQKWIRSPWSFSFWQSAVAAAVTLPFVSDWPAEVSTLGWAGLGFLAVASSVLAFSFQIMAQKVLSASVSATLCLLEAPFAALFGWWLFSDAMGSTEWIGAVLVVVAAAVAVAF